MQEEQQTPVTEVLTVPLEKPEGAVPDLQAATFPHALGVDAVLGQQGGSAEQVSLQECNRKDRRQASEWLSGDPGPMMLLVLAGLEPLEKVMHKNLQLSGEGWEQEQRAQAAECVLQGQPAKRAFRVGVAAEGTLETTFFNDLYHTYLDQVLWRLLPDEAQTVSVRSLASRALGLL